MQLTEEQIESIYESCHDKWLDSGKCINLWHTFAEYLLAAYDSGAQLLTDEQIDKAVCAVCHSDPHTKDGAYYLTVEEIRALIAEIEHLDQAKGE